MYRFCLKVKFCVFFVFLPFAFQFSLEQELCVDGVIDATFSFDDNLILFKSKTVYFYKFKQTINPPRIVIRDKTNLTVYDQLAARTEFHLFFNKRILFEEFCTIDFNFDRIQTAFHDKPNNNVFLMIENNKDHIIEVSFADKFDLKFSCLITTYSDFNMNRSFPIPFQHAIHLNNGIDRYIVFEDQYFYIFKGKWELGPFPILLVDPQFPVNADGVTIVHNQNEDQSMKEIWIFKRNRLYVMKTKVFEELMKKFIYLFEMSKDLSAKCESNLAKSTNISIIKVIYGSLENDLQLHSNGRTTIREFSTFTHFGCTIFGIDFILDSKGFFQYIIYHPIWLCFLLLLILLICAGCFFIYHLMRRKEEENIVYPIRSQHNTFGTDDRSNEKQSSSQKYARRCSEWISSKASSTSKFVNNLNICNRKDQNDSDSLPDMQPGNFTRRTTMSPRTSAKQIKNDFQERSIE